MPQICNVTGTVLLPSGDPAPNFAFILVPAFNDLQPSGGVSIVPRPISAVTDENGFIDFSVQSGAYVFEGKGARLRFGTVVTVPDAPTAFLSDLIDQPSVPVTPEAVLAAEAARDLARRWATEPTDAVAPGEFSAFKNAQDALGYRNDAAVYAANASDLSRGLAGRLDALEPVNAIRDEVVLQKMRSDFIEFAVLSCLSAKGTDWIRHLSSTRLLPGAQGAPDYTIGTLAGLYASNKFDEIGGSGFDPASTLQIVAQRAFADAVATVGTWNATSATGWSGYYSSSADAELSFDIAFTDDFCALALEYRGVFSNGGYWAVRYESLDRPAQEFMAADNPRAVTIGGETHYFVDTRNPNSTVAVVFLDESIPAGNYRVTLKRVGATGQPVAADNNLRSYFSRVLVVQKETLVATPPPVDVSGATFQPLPFTAGLVLWSSGNGTPGTTNLAASGGATIVNGDPDFGDCLQRTITNPLTKTQYMGETVIYPGIFLKITARVKVSASVGVVPEIAIAGWPGGSGGFEVPGLVQQSKPIPLNGFDDVHEISAIVTGSDHLEADFAWPGALYGHFGIDVINGGGTDVLIDDLEITDVTADFADPGLRIPIENEHYGYSLTTTDPGVRCDLSYHNGNVFRYQVPQATRIYWTYWQHVNTVVGSATVFIRNADASFCRTVFVDMTGPNAELKRAILIDDLPLDDYTVDIVNGKDDPSTDAPNTVDMRIYSAVVEGVNLNQGGIIGEDEFDVFSLPVAVSSGNYGSHVICGSGNHWYASKWRDPATATFPVTSDDFVSGVHGEETPLTNADLTFKVDGVTIDWDGAFQGQSFVGKSIELTYQTTLSFPGTSTPFGTLSRKITYRRGGVVLVETVRTLSAPAVEGDSYILMLQCPNGGDTQAAEVGGGFVNWAAERSGNFLLDTTILGGVVDDPWSEVFACWNGQYASYVALLNGIEVQDQYSGFQTVDNNVRFQDNATSAKAYLRSFGGSLINDGIALPAGHVSRVVKMYRTLPAPDADIVCAS